MTDKPVPEKVEDHDVIYALRTVHQTQTQLNVMADQKANMLVGTIVICLSFLFTRFSSLDLSNTYWIVTLAVIMLLELVGIFFGIMVIKPRAKYPNNILKLEEMPNPLFFGFYTQFKEQEYVDYMKKALSNNANSRELILRDIYQIGHVLKRKYTMLKHAYNFAGAGIMLGVISVLSRMLFQ
jgi:hypothetical protein